MKDSITVTGSPYATREERLSALKILARRDKIRPASTGEINNHIHTVYSFSPYTPSMAAWLARGSGLEAAGSVDHDSVGAAEEMLEASAILGLGSCVGFEVRVSFTGTAFEGKKLNNPDVANINYMTVQGIPHGKIGEADRFLAPIREARNARNRIQTHSASKELERAGLGQLDFDADVYPLSKAAEGGSITERHILAAVALRLEKMKGRGDALIRFLERDLSVPVPRKLVPALSDASNPHFLYDLIGVLKTGFLERIYVVPEEEECVNVRRVVSFGLGIGAVPAYAYLGDVAESPTGDKKAEKFEDEFLDDLVPGLAAIGFLAVAYMPPRNTREQLLRIQELCRRNSLLEISGVDINSSRQSFNSPEVLMPECRHLVDTTWALIAHEKLASLDRRYGMFSPDGPLSSLGLGERVARYARVGRALDRHRTEADISAVRMLEV